MILLSLDFSRNIVRIPLSNLYLLKINSSGLYQFQMRYTSLQISLKLEYNHSSKSNNYKRFTVMKRSL